MQDCSLSCPFSTSYRGLYQVARVLGSSSNAEKDCRTRTGSSSFELVEMLVACGSDRGGRLVGQAHY